MTLYYITVPSLVFSSQLSDGEKLLLGLLMSLSSQEGYCYAHNEYLARMLRKSEMAIKMILHRLKSLGFIKIQEASKKTRERKIYINDLQKLFTYSRKAYSSIPSSESDNADNGGNETPTPQPQPKPKRSATQININNVGSVVLTDKMKQYSMDKGYSEEQTTQIFEHFLSHHMSKGSSFKNWDAAFNTWLITAQRFDAKKKFSNGAPRPSSNQSTVGQRLMLENMLLEDHAVIEEHMHMRMIFMNQVLDGSIVLSDEYSDIGIMTLSTTKTGIKKIWYRKSKWAQNKNDDVISVEYIQ